MSRSDDTVDAGLALAAAGVRAALATGRLALAPVRLAARAPVVGAPIQRRARDLADDGRRIREQVRARIEEATGVLLAAPEVERAIDRAFAGTLTDAIARSLAQHRVPERVAAEIIAVTDLDALIATVLEHPTTARMVDRTLASPEMDRIVEYIATSPHIVAAVSLHTHTLAEEMTADVRRRSQVVDDVAERAVRGWLRRPREQGT